MTQALAPTLPLSGATLRRLLPLDAVAGEWVDAPEPAPSTFDADLRFFGQAYLLALVFFLLLLV